MDFESMSKEELVAFLIELQARRAFTYEDRMKLAILDESPFTIWASDRDCKITLWEGQCEVLYGYPREYAIGKDYVSLFVAPDEQSAARRDQISIIDDAAVFHNIANDIAKTGNTLQLITNCFRIKDPLTGEYWNAEMGLIIGYLEQEKKRLEQIIAESKKVKSCTNLFIEDTMRRKTEYQARKKGVRSAIAESKRKAAAAKRLTSFKDKVAPINTALEELQGRLYQLIDEYFQKIQTCADADSCEATMLEFDEAYEEMVYDFGDISAEFEELNSEFNGNNSIMQLRDDTLKITYDMSRKLDNLAYEVLNKAEDEISEYRRIGAQSDSRRFAELIRHRDEIQSQREAITQLSNTFTQRVQLVSDETQLTDLRNEVIREYKKIEDKLSTLKHEKG